MGAKMKKLDLSVTYECRPEDVFSALTDARLMSTYTHAPCKFDVKEGGKFEMFGGSITGEFTEVDENKSFTQKWRFSDWPEDLYSTVTVNLFSPSYGICVMTLKQRGIPQTDRFGNIGVPETVK